MLPIKAKSDVFDAFKQFKAYAENQSKHRIKILRDDKEGEYMSNALSQFTTECGIERKHTVRARPQQNGVAERANRVLSECLTTMLDESGLPKVFWGEGLGALVHVWNKCPTDAVKNATPYQLWNEVKHDVSHLRVWGCTAYVHIQKDKREGLGSHMEKCVFIGPLSPISIGARLPRCASNKPREWWKLSAAQLDSDIDDDIDDADIAYEVAYSSTSAAEPLSYSKALRRPDAEQWKQAELVP